MLEEIVSSLLLVIGLVQLYVVYCIYCENFGSQKRKWKLTILTLMSTAFMICDFAYRRMPNGISMSIYSLFGEGALYCHMLYQLDILETFQKIRESKQSGLISFLRWSLFLWFIFVLFPVVPTHIGFLPLPYTTIWIYGGIASLLLIALVIEVAATVFMITVIQTSIKEQRKRLQRDNEHQIIEDLARNQPFSRLAKIIVISLVCDFVGSILLFLGMILRHIVYKQETESTNTIDILAVVFFGINSVNCFLILKRMQECASIEETETVHSPAMNAPQNSQI